MKLSANGQGNDIAMATRWRSDSRTVAECGCNGIRILLLTSVEDALVGRAGKLHVEADGAA